MNVTAFIADHADGRLVCPVEIKECSNGRVQLSFSPLKFIMAADLTLEHLPLDLVALRFAFIKQAHDDESYIPDKG